MDEAKKEEIRKWLIKAERDIGSAEKLLSGENSFPDTAVYHCQQAAEKALKAYLTLKDIPFQKVHDLTALVDACAETDQAFERIRVAGEILTPYAVAFRYPTDPGTLPRGCRGCSEAGERGYCVHQRKNAR